MVLSTESAEFVRDEIVAAAELTDRDFVGVFEVLSGWALLGACQRGVAQPLWPHDEPMSGE